MSFKTIFLHIFFIHICSCSYAQNFFVTVKTTDRNLSPIIGATIKLYKNDSTQKSLAITDTTGNATFGIAKGNYTIIVSSISYKQFVKSVNFINTQNDYHIMMENDENQLSNITVVAQKKLMEQEDDKIIINPEQIANSSMSGYEILEKTPGIFLDMNGNVYINSTTPATVYINGREQKMSSADIMTILKGLPPNSIEKIEFIRTPSSKFEASNTGGIVNIILKKGIKTGVTGSINTGINQGKYSNQFVGINVNRNSGKNTHYLNFNYNNRNNYESIYSHRDLSNHSTLTQETLNLLPNFGLFGSYGLGITISKKLDVSFDGLISKDGSLNSSDYNNQITNNNILSNNFDKVNADSKAFNISNGLNTKYKLDTLGSTLTSDISYNYILTDSYQNYETQFIQHEKSPNKGDGNIKNIREQISAKFDLSYNFSKLLICEAGIKSAFLSFNSNSLFFSNINNTQIADDVRTRKFNYSEQINSAYIQLTKKYKSFTIKLGYRLEGTKMEGNQQIPMDTTFKVNRYDLFPYIYLSKKIITIAGYQLSGYLIYRQSINRPSYEFLNPFPKYVNQYLYDMGNPKLQPQFTKNYEVNISVDEKPIFAIGRNYTQNVFTNVVYQDTKNNSILYRTYDNLGRNIETYFRAVTAIPPTGKYFFVAGIQYNYNNYYGQYDNNPLVFKRGSITLFTFHQIKIDKLSTFIVNGFYRIKGQLQFYELTNFGNINLSINRNFLKSKLQMTLSLTDPFLLNKYTFSIDQGNISTNSFRRSDTRRVGVNIRYNLGIKKKEDKINPLNLDYF